MIELDVGTAADLSAIRDLLLEARLPLDGLMAVPTTLVVARDHRRLVGAGALESHGSDALLRSLVVSPEVRNVGIGSGIVTELERLAAAGSVGGIYLLTESAAGFFSGVLLSSAIAAPENRTAASVAARMEACLRMDKPLSVSGGRPASPPVRTAAVNIGVKTARGCDRFIAVHGLAR